MTEILQQIIDEINARLRVCNTGLSNRDYQDGAIMGLLAAKAIVQRQLSQVTESRWE